MDTIANRDFIFTGLQAWDIPIGSNAKNLAIEISKMNRVLYVNPPVDRLTLLRNPTDLSTKRYKNCKNNPHLQIQQISSTLWVLTPCVVIESINQLPINWLFDLLNKHNNRLLAAKIRKTVAELHFENFIHICDSDMFRSFYLKSLLNPALCLYYTRDNLLAVDYWKRQGARIEPRFMSKADAVIANSTYLQKRASRYNVNSFFVGQGCDLQAFTSKISCSVPDELMSIKHPIIGYVGAVKSLRLDIELLNDIAITCPHWSIVLVGPEDDAFKASVLHSLPNVHFLDSRPEADLPMYINAFDVAINPQIVNEITQGNYPRKIDEYLAMGKAVVATRTEAMDYFAQHVSLANSLSEWIAKIDYELQSDSPAKHSARMDFAGQHTWEKNVGEIYGVIFDLEKHKRHDINSL